MLFIRSAHSRFAFLFAVHAIIYNYEGACNCKALLLVKRCQAVTKICDGSTTRIYEPAFLFVCSVQTLCFVDCCGNICMTNKEQKKAVRRSKVFVVIKFNVFRI